ncbi:fumarylacetoacetate hydrolase family protein [Actinoplanes sp. NPDC049265]|uniref:fumarylacetoacetate hydrolase family protein n=1 Tax=Actinoplanes sp. NPDC049265 TaxID=3363902 RepID=UPI0037186DE8
MKFRRRLVSGRIETQKLVDGGWQRTDSTAWATSISAEEEARLLPDHDDSTDAVLLPVRPRSFRDFMVFERHMIDAARGMTARFAPRVARFAHLVEQVSRRPFPRFRPDRLWYREPIYYMSNALTFVPSGTPVAPPPYSTAFDYEFEIGFVLAEPLYNASPEAAAKAIGAVFLLNDVSARDVQRGEMLSGFGPQRSKHFVSSMSDTAITAEAVVPEIGRTRTPTG